MIRYKTMEKQISYPAIFTYDKKTRKISVYIPDFEAWSYGRNWKHAFYMAEERLQLALLEYEERGIDFPEPYSCIFMLQKGTFVRDIEITKLIVGIKNNKRHRLIERTSIGIYAKNARYNLTKEERNIIRFCCRA